MNLADRHQPCISCPFHRAQPISMKHFSHSATRWTPGKTHARTLSDIPACAIEHDSILIAYLQHDGHSYAANQGCVAFIRQSPRQAGATTRNRVQFTLADPRRTCTVGTRIGIRQTCLPLTLPFFAPGRLTTGTCHDRLGLVRSTLTWQLRCKHSAPSNLDAVVGSSYE